jgi:hypothetical protein
MVDMIVIASCNSSCSEQWSLLRKGSAMPITGCQEMDKSSPSEHDCRAEWLSSSD